MNELQDFIDEVIAVGNSTIAFRILLGADPEG